MKKRIRLALRNRRGVSLVELIVAVTILMFGMLTIVGISSTTARSLGESRSDNLAAITATSRFEYLASLGCTMSSGVATGLSGVTTNTAYAVTTRGVTERYRVVLGANNTLILYDSLSWETRRITRRQAFMTLLPCRTGA